MVFGAGVGGVGWGRLGGFGGVWRGWGGLGCVGGSTLFGGALTHQSLLLFVVTLQWNLLFNRISNFRKEPLQVPSVRLQSSRLGFLKAQTQAPVDALFGLSKRRSPFCAPCFENGNNKQKPRFRLLFFARKSKQREADNSTPCSKVAG